MKTLGFVFLCAMILVGLYGAMVITEEVAARW
jgi:hypothetical protein